MPVRRTLKIIHVASTAWFALCVGYIFVLVLRQVGLHWWVIFSLSGHSAVIIFLVISLYLFAIFRGVARTQKSDEEHPLTNTTYYVVFYALTPFLGGLAGCIGMLGVHRASEFLLGIALGTLGATFLVWVIVDPLIGLLEASLPASRKHRAERLAQAKAVRESKRKAREHLLTAVLADEESDRCGWQEALKPQAEKLAGLLKASATNFKQAEREAVDIGVKAWQMGGLGCMRQLHDMAKVAFKQKGHNGDIVDYIPIWWDGIGSWRRPSLQDLMNLQS